MSLVLFFLLVAVYFDMLLLKRRDGPLFARVIDVSAPEVVCVAALIAAVLIFSGSPWEDLPPAVLLFILPAYLLRRGRFTRSLNLDPSEDVTALLSSALGVIIIWTYGVITFSLFLPGVMDLFSVEISEMAELVFSAVFSTVLIVILVYQSAQYFSDRGFWANVGLRRTKSSWAREVVLPAAFGLFFAVMASYLALARHVQPQTPLSEVLETTRSFGLIVIFLVLAIGVAPFVEEIVFRGYFFYVIKQWLGRRRAVYIIALTFAALHVGQYWGDWLAIMMVTALGFTLTILRALSGSTLPGVITHYVYNASVAVIPVVMIILSNPAYFQYRAYYSQHDFKTKEELLKASIMRQPDLAEAYNDLAWLYAQESVQLDVALWLAEKALSYDPDNRDYLDTRSEILKKLGN